MTAVRLRQRTIEPATRLRAPRHHRPKTPPAPRQPACAEPDCATAALDGQSYCLAHVLVLRARLGQRCCAERHCARPRYNSAAVCRAHLEASLFGRVVTAEATSGPATSTPGETEPVTAAPVQSAPAPVSRPAVTTTHVRRVRGLECAYSAAPLQDSTAVGLTITGYVRGEKVGLLAAALNADQSASIRMIHVEPDCRRRGVASALYEVFRAEHPRIPVGHGHRTPPARIWWRKYCEDRGLDPLDPLS